MNTFCSVSRDVRFLVHLSDLKSRWTFLWRWGVRPMTFERCLGPERVDQASGRRSLCHSWWSLSRRLSFHSPQCVNDWLTCVIRVIVFASTCTCTRILENSCVYKTMPVIRGMVSFYRTGEEKSCERYKVRLKINDQPWSTLIYPKRQIIDDLGLKEKAN